MVDEEAEEDEIVSSVGFSRYPCMPSLVALQQMRNRLHLAHLGRKLMKWTSLATSKELRRIGHEYLDVSKNYGEDVRDAYILLARCRYFYPNLNTMVTENLLRYPNEAVTTVGTSFKHVTGVLECHLEVMRSDDVPYPHLGVDKGGEVIAEAKRVWYELLRLMVLILELKLNFEAAELSHKGATKKANVLSKVIVPRINYTIRYIVSELEELEREEFYRMKKVLALIERKIEKSKKGEEKRPMPRTHELVPKPITVHPSGGDAPELPPSECVCGCKPPSPTDAAPAVSFTTVGNVTLNLQRQGSFWDVNEREISKIMTRINEDATLTKEIKTLTLKPVESNNSRTSGFSIQSTSSNSKN